MGSDLNLSILAPEPSVDALPFLIDDRCIVTGHIKAEAFKAKYIPFARPSERLPC